MDVVNAILKPVAEILMNPVKKHLGYLISCTEYVRDMGTKMRELNAAREGVKEHKERNIRSRLEVPAQVTGWLEEVEKITAKVESLPTDVSCLKLKTRYNLGRKAFELIEKIKSVMTQHSLITWTDRPIPVGKVDFIKSPTSTPSIDHHDDFRSREETFTKALKALQTNIKSHMIALCGMGGVGKTTMMQRLKMAAIENKMFDYIVEAVIGEKTDPLAIQQAVADYLGIRLEEKTKPARADKLRDWFKRNLMGGNKRLLVILDDVWQTVDMEDIGLSRLPNQGVDFKVLLTSRDSHVCTMMGVEGDSILNVRLLTEAEAQNLFRQFVETSDPELHKIGEDIVRKCCGLPIAIKTMACTLRYKCKDAWKDALSRLEHNNIDNVAPNVFKTSYANLQDEETKSIFLLCGLFPEDFDIPTEELVRYGWGLKLFESVYSVGEARNRLNTCIERLMQTNLLIESDYFGRVKMHDLVRAFVLHLFSLDEHASIVNHGHMPGWPKENDMSSSCKRISLTCKGMSEIPQYLSNFPNLSLLKLMHGDKSLRFPRDFYGEMQKLQVISYDQMEYPLLPSSPQCSTNLRVLRLHACSLRMFDCSSIGNHLNLEVLSFANSDIDSLPSTIRKLKKLRLLDLTNCECLHINKGILQNLVMLEELYMGAGGQYGKAISLTDENYEEYGKAINLTDENYEEIAERSENLGSLEFEIFENNVQPKKMSFKRLERFKISVGHSLDRDFRKSGHPFENMLMLETNKSGVLESRMNKLFEKTQVLYLSVGDMNYLSDVEVESFQNLRVLFISECVELKYLFTFGVAKTLSNLELLKVYKCNNMKELLHSGVNGEETITFPKLKFLYLAGLPKLLGLCDNVNIIELPQLVKLKLENIPGFTSIYPNSKLETSCLLKKEVVVPKLEKLHIDRMNNLKEIWPCGFGTSVLRRIKVTNCDSLVNLFPCNPMSLIHHLEKLQVKNCGSIKILFDIDLDSVDETEGSSLRSIEVCNLSELRVVWRIKGSNSQLPIHGFQNIESIDIQRCTKFRSVFIPITANFDLRAFKEISIQNLLENEKNDDWTESSHEEEDELVESSQEEGDELVESSREEESSHEEEDELVESSQEEGDELVESSREEESSHEEEINNMSEEEEIPEIRDSISNNAFFPSCLVHSFYNLHKLRLSYYKGVEVVFEMESPRSRELEITHDNQRLLPYLEELHIEGMESMHHVWKCNWNKYLILQKQLRESPFHNLTNIQMEKCNSIKYLFSPLMAKLLSNIKKVEIRKCDGIEEVVSNKAEEEENTMSTFTSTHTNCTTLFPHLDSLTLYKLPMLRCIGGGGCAKGTKNELSPNSSTAFDDQFKFSSESGGVSWSLCQYAKEIRIEGCHALSSVIPSYAAGQMQKLQLLKIKLCRGMKEIFETQGMSGCDEVNTQQTIPRPNDVIMLKLSNLKILEILWCNGLKHVFPFSALESLGKLEELKIEYCYRMKVIVKEEEASSKEVVVFPRLKSIELKNLLDLKGFFLGMNKFQWPSLDKVTINNCPEMTVFAPGGSTAPRLKYMHTTLGKHSVGEYSLNFHEYLTNTTSHHQTPLFPSLDDSSSSPATSKERRPWSFHNLIELNVEFDDDVKSIIPSNELLKLQNLEKIFVFYCDEVEEVFEEAGRNSSTDESQTTTTTTLVTLPNLRVVELAYLDSLRYMWKSNEWTVFQFPNLTTISIDSCKSLKHVFTSSMVGSLLKLQELSISECEHMEEVIVSGCSSVKEVFEEAGRNSSTDESQTTTTTTLVTLPNLREIELHDLPCLRYMWKSNEWTLFQFPNLTTISIDRCKSLKHVFSSSMVGGLLQLQQLHIHWCMDMEEVIVKDSNVGVEEEEESDAKPNQIITLPCLNSLHLSYLPSLKGFCLGKEDFSFPLLDTLEFIDCPAITTFTNGHLATPKLREILTSRGSFYAGEDLNSFIKINQEKLKKDW